MNKAILVKTLVLLPFLCTVGLNAQPNQPEQYASLMYAYPDLNISGSTIDSKGNTYVTGIFADSLQLADKTLYSRGSLDIYLAKFDSRQDMEWVKQAGGAFMDVCQYVQADTNDNIYVSGLFRGRLVFGDTAIFSNGKVRYFTAKYTDDGNLLWIRQNSKIK